VATRLEDPTLQQQQQHPSIHPSIRVVNFIADGTQKDKQRFIDLLHAKMDQEWEARKAVSHRSVYYYKADVSAH
jgi:hypothetical protein